MYPQALKVCFTLSREKLTEKRGERRRGYVYLVMIFPSRQSRARTAVVKRRRERGEESSGEATSEEGRGKAEESRAGNGEERRAGKSRAEKREERRAGKSSAEERKGAGKRTKKQEKFVHMHASPAGGAGSSRWGGLGSAV